MAKCKWYRFLFEDGTVTICRGYDRTEMENMVRKHGKLINKVLDGRY